MSLTEAVLAALEGLNRNALNRAQPHDLLRETRAHLADFVRAAYAYRKTPDGLVLWLSDGPPHDAPSHLLLSAVVSTGQTYHDKGLLLAPIFVESEIHGALALKLAEDTADIATWLPAAVTPLCARLGEYLLSETLQHLAQVTAQLNTATTFRDIANAIAPAIVQQGQFITITLFEYDTGESFHGVRVIATANRKSAYATDEYIQLNISAFTERLARIPDDQPGVLFTDIAHDPEVPDDVRDWLGGHHIQSLFVLPLRSVERTYGFLGLNDTRQPIYMPPSRAWRLRNLAEHVSAAIQRHNLTEVTSQTQRISERLAQTFIELNASQDYDELATTIARHMLADTNRFIILSQLNYNDADQISDWTMLASTNQEPSDRHLSPNLRWQDLPLSARQQIQDGKWHLITAADRNNPDWTPEARAHFNDIAAMLNIPIAIEGRISIVLRVVSRQTTTFTREEINAFTNLGKQLSALIQTRLGEKLALNVIQANRRIALANTYGEIAQSALETAPDYLDYVGIALFDQPISPDETPRQLILAASARRNHLEEPNLFDTIDETTAIQTFIAPFFNNQQPLTANLADAFARVAPAISRHIHANDVDALFFTGLSVANRLQGLLIFGSTRQSLLSGMTEHNLRLVADQLTVTIENRNLLKRTEAIVEELGILQDINQELLEAGDIQGMLEVIKAYVGHDANNLYYLEMTYDEDDALSDIHIRYQFDASGRLESTNISLRPLSDLSGLTTYWERISSGLEIIEDFDDLRQKAPIVALLQSQNIKSMVTIPIFDMGQRTEQISIVWNKQRRFDDLDLRLFRAIQTQFTILRQNQKLLRSAQISAARLGIQVRLLRTLNSYTSDINNLGDEKRILDLTAQVFCDALGADHVGIAIIEPSGELATVVAEYPGQAAIGLKVEANRGAMLLLKRSSQAILVRDIANDERLEPQSRAALQSLGVRSVLFLPLLDREKRLFGSIGLDILREGYQFDSDAIEMAQTLATQAGIAVQKARLQQQTERRNTQLQAVADFSRAVQSARETLVVLQNASRTARRILPTDLMSIILKDHDDQFRYQWLYQHGADTPRAQLPALSLGHSLYEAVLQKSETLYIYDLSLHQIQHPLDSSLRSSVLVPLMMRGTIVGAIEIGAKEAYAYNETDVSVLQQFASLIIAAIENARSYEQALRLAEYKAQSNEIAARLQQQMDMESLLHITAGELGKALGARRARIRLGGSQADKS